MNRVEHLADRAENFVLETAPGYRNLVPLIEIIADSMGVGKESIGAGREYHSLIQRLGSEFHILLYMTKEEILERCPPAIAAGIINVREGRVRVLAGYDGVYGTIEIFAEGSKKEDKQLTFF